MVEYAKDSRRDCFAFAQGTKVSFEVQNAEIEN